MACEQPVGVARYTVEELTHYFLERGVRDGVVSHFKKHLVNGAAFLQLTEDDLKELVPLVGERVFLRQILKQSKLVRLTSWVHL